jgi:hypothetical protein
MASQRPGEAECYLGTTPAEKIDSRPVSGPAMGTVHCRDCQHFTPDAINPPEGVGLCGATLTGLPPKGQRGYGCCYPSSPRACPNFQQKEPTI